MVMQQRKGIKWNLSPIVILSWFALMAQFYLIIENRIPPIPEVSANISSAAMYAWLIPASCSIGFWLPPTSMVYLSTKKSPCLG